MMKKAKQETAKPIQEPTFTYVQDESESTALEQMFFRLFDEVMKQHINNN